MSQATLLDTTKAVIKALIVSSPEQLTIDRLDQIYLRNEGRKIPFSMLGYPTLKSFLSSIPDILDVNTHNNTVKLVVSKDDNSAHVLKMVTEQRPSKNSRSNRGNHNNSQNFKNSQNVNNLNQLINNHRNRSAIWDYQPPMFNQQHSQNGFGRQHFNMQQQTTNQLLPPRFEPGNLLAPPNTLTPNQNMMHFYNNNKPSLLGMPAPHIPSLMHIPVPELAMSRCSLNDGHSKQSSTPKEETVKKQSPPTMDVHQNDSNNLNGHADTTEDDRCHSNDSKEVAVAALPPIDDNDPILFIGSRMKNCKFGYSIPPAVVPTNLKVGDVHQIFITEITSLPHFYFRFYETRNLMSRLEEQLRWCYDDLKISTFEVQVGNVIGALYRDKLLRAEILTKPDDDDRFKMLFVDFGTIEYVPSSSIRYLPTELCEIPRLCHRGALDFMGPLTDYKAERKIIKTFCEMVADKSLMAVISDVDENDTISMTLVDTSSPDVDVIVNEVLLEGLEGSKSG